MQETWVGFWVRLRTLAFLPGEHREACQATVHWVRVRHDLLIEQQNNSYYWIKRKWGLDFWRMDKGKWMFHSKNVPQASKYFRLNSMFDSPFKMFYHIERYLSDIKRYKYLIQFVLFLFIKINTKQKLFNSNILQTHNAIPTHITTLWIHLWLNLKYIFDSC